MKKTFDVTGMSCSACSAKVEKTVEKLEGVKNVSVNLLTNNMKVEFDEGSVSEKEICEAVIKAGYGASSSEETGKTKGRAAAAGEGGEKTGLRLGASIGFLAVIMYLSMGHMIGLHGPEILSGTKNALSMALALFILSLPIMYLNRGYYIRGFGNLFKLSPNMDSLIAVGSAAAMAYGVFAMFRISYGLGHMEWALVDHYRHQLYFESGVMILTLISVGKYLEEKAKKRTGTAISKLIDLAPKTATLYVNGEEKQIPVEDVRVGDVLSVKGGASIPVDGSVIEGRADIDESSITGESMPVLKEKGDKVIAATINTSGAILMVADKVGEDTVFAQIVKLVEEASSSKPPISRLADRISGIFVPVVMAIALLTMAAWKLAGADFEFAMTSAVSVLVISCPCALGLATPVAVMVGIGKGAEHGLMFKSGEALETLHKVDKVLLDKTGTITEGRPKVTDIQAVGVFEDELFRLMSSLEKNSQHPVAKGLVAEGDKRGAGFYDVEGFEEITGKGLTGKNKETGDLIMVGSVKFFEEQEVDISAVNIRLMQWASEGKTPILCGLNHKICGAVALMDIPKESSAEAIAELENMGIGVAILTGDNEKTAKNIAGKVGVKDVIFEVLPEEKAHEVAKLKEKGHVVAMVGDGINDAPALTEADIGIAIGNGTDIAIESGDVVLMKNDVFHVVSAINLSKATIRNIKQNLFWAFFYNVLCIPLAAGVFYSSFGIRLTPMIGAAAMSCSSLFVVSNALRLKRVKPGIGGRDEGLKTEIVSLEENEIVKQNILNEEDESMLKMNVEGMMCQNCVKHIKNALEAFDGVQVEVDLDKKSVEFKSVGTASQEELKKAVEDAGYEVLKFF